MIHSFLYLTFTTMGPEGFRPPGEPVEDLVEQNEKRIRLMFHSFFMYMYQNHKRHILTRDIIDFSSEHDPDDAPVMLAMHIVHLLIKSYISAMKKTEEVNNDAFEVLQKITSLVENEFWDFRPSPKYLDLACRFLLDISK